jgi:molybdate transport system permease protein
MRVACMSVALLVVPGVLLGYGLARKNFVGKPVVEALVHAPLVLPPVVTGYLLLLVLGNNGFVGRWLHERFGIETEFTLTAAAIASAVVAMPLMVRAVRLAMTVADRKLEQASYTLGAGPIKTFLLISLPLAAPGVVAGMVLAFARSLGEFGATAVFMGNIEGQRTVPLAIYSSLQVAHGEQSAWRLVAISVVVSMLAVTISEILARRAGRYLEQDHAS